MQCCICPNPAASPHNGAEYIPGVVACRACVGRLWGWLLFERQAAAPSGKKRRRLSKRRRERPHGELDFYEAVGRWRAQ